MDNQTFPLHTPWTFWIDRCFTGMSEVDYRQNLKKIYTVKSIEEFWSVYNNIPHVDKLPSQFSYHFMRHDWRPLWEDEATRAGGVWRISIPKMRTKEIWENLLIAAIGEHNIGDIDSDDKLCGLSIAMRGNCVFVKIWNQDSSKAKDQTMRDYFANVLGLRIVSNEYVYIAHQKHMHFKGKIQDENKKGQIQV